METCPKIAQLRPPVEGRQPLRLAIEANKLPTGAYSAYGAFSAHFIWCGSAVYPPVGLTPGAYLAYLAYFANFYSRRDNSLMIAFDRLSGITPRGCQIKMFVDSAADRKAIPPGLKAPEVRSLPLLFSVRPVTP
jgi:hypothetical protein